jgi:hypothetical protein
MLALLPFTYPARHLRDLSFLSQQLCQPRRATCVAAIGQRRGVESFRVLHRPAYHEDSPHSRQGQKETPPHRYPSYPSRPTKNAKRAARRPLKPAGWLHPCPKKRRALLSPLKLAYRGLHTRPDLTLPSTAEAAPNLKPIISMPCHAMPSSWRQGLAIAVP